MFKHVTNTISDSQINAMKEEAVVCELQTLYMYCFTSMSRDLESRSISSDQTLDLHKTGSGV